MYLRFLMLRASVFWKMSQKDVVYSNYTYTITYYNFLCTKHALSAYSFTEMHCIVLKNQSWAAARLPEEAQVSHMTQKTITWFHNAES